MTKPILLSMLIATSWLQSKAQIIFALKTNFNLSAATSVADEQDFLLVKKPAKLSQPDIKAHIGKEVSLQYNSKAVTKNTIIAGSITSYSFIKAPGQPETKWK